MSPCDMSFSRRIFFIFSPNFCAVDFAIGFNTDYYIILLCFGSSSNVFRTTVHKKFEQKANNRFELTEKFLKFNVELANECTNEEKLHLYKKVGRTYTGGTTCTTTATPQPTGLATKGIKLPSRSEKLSSGWSRRSS
jgi:hypothetical protein